jgi:hypothetical protein
MPYTKAKQPMSVKITNTSPKNGDMNVPIVNGFITAKGTVDENGTTVTASIQSTSGIVGGTPIFEFCNAGDTWSFQLPAQPLTYYNIIVQGVNQNGTGSSIITIKTGVGARHTRQPPKKQGTASSNGMKRNGAKVVASK